MIRRTSLILKMIIGFGSLLVSFSSLAGPVYQPPGANLTLGDVTHGKRIRGTVLSAAAGLEYGNIQNLFDFYDEVTGAYAPGDPGVGGGPGQLPEDKPGGIDLGEIWDNLDPDITDAIEVLAAEVATQAALLALIKEEGHGKAWLAVDAPFVIGNEYLGGTWTFGFNWSGRSKAYGLTQTIQFDRDAARQELEDWFNTLPINRPVQLPISSDILLSVDPVTNAVLFSITNDSSIVTKSTQTTELDLGYSRRAWSTNAGSLYLGAEARIYLMRLSRLSVRYGDITDSEELFDEIRDNDFRSDEDFGVDVGAL